MRIPPWLAGLLMVLVLALLWWALQDPSDDGTEEAAGTATSSSRDTGTASNTGPTGTGSTDPGHTDARPDDSADADPTEDADPTDDSADEGPAEEATGGSGATASGPSDTPTTEPEAVGPEPTGVDTRDWDGIPACDDDILPATMIPVVEDIWAGGPYAYPDRDGTRFGNFEGFLPDEHRTYYREFTVETPGLHHRGARRIVTGGDQETDPDVWYYTQDHYESFCEFAP